MDDIRIYITNLAKYNGGILSGKWVDLPLDPEDLQAEIAEVLGKDEEYFITDYEAPFEIGEYDSITELNEFVQALEDLNDPEAVKKIAYLLDDGCDRKEALNEVDDLEFYPGWTLRQLAEQLVDDGVYGEIPEVLQNYIDYDAIARDLDCSDYHETSAGVFRRI